MIGRTPFSARRSVVSFTFAAALALTGSAGCAVGPEYRRPDAVATMPDAYAGATGDWKVATPQADLSKGPWWEIFGDSVLNRLETEAGAANQDIKAAAARFAQARAGTGAARSGLFPRVGAGAAATVQHDSANRPLSTSGEAAGKSFTYENFSVPFDASWELDLWGRVRRQAEAAAAGELASAADLEAVKLSIAAEVAVDYFALRELEAETATLSSSVAAYGRALELTTQRRRGGLASDLDVAQAETVLNAAEAQLPSLSQARLRYQHALAVLVGQPASLFQLAERPSAGEAPEAKPPLVKPHVPSELLERRPDVAAAERRMASANAGIGVAKAAFFPTIRLTGLGGLQSTDSGTLLAWPSRLWAIGPSLYLPLFDGGQRRAGFDTAQARYEETVALYRQTVLKAFAEVEDQLAAQRLLLDQLEREGAAWASAARQLSLAENRYRGGVASYLQVTSAQAAALDHERTVTRLRGQQFAACVALVKSLGGGWEGLSDPVQFGQR
jgi:multidrug efflux system outer membrane protein